MYLKKLIYIAFFLILVCESKSQTLTITSPANSVILSPGNNITIKWNNSSTNNIDLYYSFDNIKWNLIEAGISGNSFNWTVPFTNSKNIYFKISLEKFAKPVLLWDEENAHNKEIKCIRFISDNKILSAGADNYVKIWDLNSRKVIYSILIENYGQIQSAIETAPGVIAVNLDTTVFLWDYKLSKLTKIINNKNLGYIRFIDYDVNTSTLALACNDGIVRIYDLNGNLINQFITETENTLYTVKFSRDGILIAAAGYNGYIYIYDRINKTTVKSNAKHGDNVNTVIWSVDISPNNKYFISGGVDATVRMWDINSLSEVKRFYHKFHVRTVEFSNKGNIYLSSSLDSTLNQFTSSLTSNIPGVFINHNGQILSSHYSSTADSFATAGRDLSFKIWKNFDYSVTSDVVNCFLYKSIEIYAPHIVSKTGANIQIPIKIRNSDNLPPDFIKNLEITLSLPKDLLSLKDVIFSNKSNADDTLNFKISDMDDNTLLVFDGEVLKGARKSAIFDLISVKMPDSMNFQVVLDDGSLELIDSCQSDQDRLIEIINEKPIAGIYPNPINDLVNLKIDLVEDSKYKFELVDINGTVISKLFDEEMKSGEKEFQFDIKKYPNGVYFIKITWYNKSKFIKFIKSN